MKTRLALIGVALVLAMTGTVSVFAYVRHADARAVSGLQAATAYIAQRKVDAGTSLQAAVDSHAVVRQTLPRKTVPADAITEISDQIGVLVATHDIPAGSLLVNASFAKQPEVTGGLPIPTGDMAISVALEDPQRVGEFVKPGSDIAVFDTYNNVVTLSPQGDRQPGNADAAAGDGLSDGHTTNRTTRLLLDRIRVIAVGSSVAKPQNLHHVADADSGQKPTGGQTVLVTVAVTQAEAEKLIEATQTGHLYLALLTPDSRVGPSHGIDSTELFH